MLITQSYWKTIPPNEIKAEVLRVLPKLKWSTFVPLKTNMLELVTSHMKDLKESLDKESNTAVPGWEGMGKHLGSEVFVMHDQCQFLKEHNMIKKKRYETKKQFLNCLTPRLKK